VKEFRFYFLLITMKDNSLFKETKTIKESQGMRAGPSQGMVARTL
jgi:hypothetical protein